MHVTISQKQDVYKRQVEGCAEVVVITEKVREGDFRTAIEELRNRDSVRKISTIIRVYGK